MLTVTIFTGVPFLFAPAHTPHSGAGKTVKYVALAVGLAFVGFAAAWLSVCIYNRVKRHREANKDTQFSGHTSWKKQAADPNMI